MIAVVLAKTKMGKNICVGAAEVASGRPLRLIPAKQPDRKYGSWVRFDPAVGDTIELVGSPAPDIQPPHVEDFLVERFNRIGPLGQPLHEWIAKHCKVWTGPPACLFDGCLRVSGRGWRWLSRGPRMPAGSVGFWRLPFGLERADEGGKIRYCHRAGLGNASNINLSFVANDQIPPAVIAPGTLVRVSLARWWSPEGASEGAENEEYEKCWLQLSRVYPVDEARVPTRTDIPF